MITIKTPQEVASMHEAGHILAQVLEEVCKAVKPGVSEIEMDALAERLIQEKGGEAGFKRVSGWHHAICALSNDVVVHGIPSKRVLKTGDIFGIDCGVYLDGLHTDMAETVRVEAPEATKRAKEDEIDRFLRIGKEAMWDGIAQVKAGNRVGDISAAMQDKVERVGGYHVVRSLVGHGVGRELHEEPEIPGYIYRKREKTPLLREGMTIAIEIIYIMGTEEVVYGRDDDWTIVSADGSLSAMFERSVLVTRDGYEVLTK